MLEKKYYSATQVTEACAFIDGKAYMEVMTNLAKQKGADVIVCGDEYPIDDYTIRFVYGEDSVTPTHFIITRFDMPKPVAETEE